MIQLVTAVFVCVYLGMALGRWPGLMLDRTGIALVGAIALIIGGAVTGDEVRAAIDVPTLVILFGLMVLSAQYASSGFYAWCSRRIAGAALGPAAAGAHRGDQRAYCRRCWRTTSSCLR